MTRLIIALLTGYFFWMSSFALPVGQKPPYDFLIGGVNMDHYYTCQHVLKKCPLQGSYPQLSCVHQTAQHYPYCQQLDALAQALEFPAALIKVERLNNLSLVRLNFIADGQEQYYVISPQGYLINMAEDPRHFNAKLAGQYPGALLSWTTSGKPSYKKHKDGTQSINVTFKLTAGCPNCALIGYARFNYNFTANGELSGLTLSNLSA